MNNKTCCILDTCTLSTILKEEYEINESEKRCIQNLNIIKQYVSTFIIPTVVLHELSLGIPNNENNEETFNIIFKKIKLYFNENFKIDELSSESINGYKEIYEKTKMLSDNKYKHKIDALIVAHASKVSKLLSSKYNNFWLLTEDKKMRNNYKVNNLKIYLLDEALDELGIDKHRMLV